MATVSKENVHRVRFNTVNVLVVVTADDIYLKAKSIVSYLNLTSTANEYRKMQKLGMDLADFILPSEFGGRGKTQKFMRIDEVERYLASFNTPHARFRPPLGFAEAIRSMKETLIETILEGIDDYVPPAEPPAEPEAVEPEPSEPVVEEPPAEEERKKTPEEERKDLRKRIRILQMDMFGIEVLITNALEDLHMAAENLTVYKKRLRAILRDAQNIGVTDEED